MQGIGLLWTALVACSASDAHDETGDSAADEPTAEDSGTPADPGVRLSEVQERVFTPSCAVSFCHDAAAQGRPRLVEGLAWGDLVGVPSAAVPGATLVIPGEPTNSYLAMKLNGTVGIAGNQMPLGQNLDSTLVTLVEHWIRDGALDN